MKLERLFENASINFDFLNNVIQGTWTINKDGTVNVDGIVDLARRAPHIEVLPVRFNVVTKKFVCSPSMVSLFGTPRKCHTFIGHNLKNLKNLSHVPEEVGVFGLTGLTITKMSYTPRLVHEKFVFKNSPAIEILWPQGTYTEVDVSKTKVSNFGKLRKKVSKLDLLYANDCQNLSSFKGLPDYVERLYVENCNIRQLNFPQNVKYIGKLYISGNPVLNTDFEKPDFIKEIIT